MNRSNEPILSNELDYPTVLQEMRSGKHPQFICKGRGIVVDVICVQSVAKEIEN